MSKQCVGWGLGVHLEKEGSHTGDNPNSGHCVYRSPRVTRYPKLPETGVHRPRTQLGVELEVGGKYGAINWPRYGVEALHRKAPGVPSQSVWGSCLHFPLRRLWKPLEQEENY